jgi:UDP-N-acetylmuramate dehydrogenase
MQRTVRWAIIGAGNIAHRFADSLAKEPSAELVAAYARDPKKLAAFAAEKGVARAYGSVEELLADESIDAVYVSLPHGMHKDAAVAALKAGKAVLCEKPAALTAADAAEIVGVALDEDVLFMEAMKCRFTPLAEKVRAYVGEGLLGEPGGIEVQFLRDFGAGGPSYLHDPVQGGVALDMGTYCASWLAEYADGAILVDACDNVYDGCVDIEDHVRMQIGDVACRVDVAGDKGDDATATLRFEHGSIEVAQMHRPERAVVRRDGLPDLEWDLPYDGDDFSGEIRHFQNLLASGAKQSDVMSLEDTLRCARIVDAMKSGYDRYALAEALAVYVGDNAVLMSEPMAAHTTFKIGGPADILVTPRTPKDVENVLRTVREAGAPYFVLGLGSDLLVSDAGYHGVVIDCSAHLNDIVPDGDRLACQAGMAIADVSEMAATLGLSGLEFACGIPGTVGGAVYMNAGAYDGCCQDVLESATVVMPDGSVRTLSNGELDFGYRSSRVRTEGLVVLEATFRLTPADSDQIRSKMDDFTRKREEKQPLEMPSAGSTFKRPEGYFVGKLLTDAGLKGFSLGGAQVSPKHAGFVVNADDATAADVRNLIEHVRDVIREQNGVELEPEVQFLGRF